MKKSKSTRRALLTSVLCFVLSFAMLIGTTFAWFTDSVTSGKNKIVSGILDVELYYGDNLDEKVDENTSLFNQDALWEPGYVEVVPLKVANVGTLALKYQFSINIVNEQGSTNVNNEEFKLSDYIKFAVVKGEQNFTKDAEGRANAIAAAEKAGSVNISELSTNSQSGTLYPNGKETEEYNSEQKVTLVVFMPDTVGNEANHKTGEKQPTITLGVNLVATQVEFEEDSFGDDYDKNAGYPKIDTVTAMSNADGSAAFVLQTNTPVGEGETRVKFEAGALKPNAKYTLDVKTAEVVEEAEEDADKKIAYIELTLKDPDGKVVTKFNEKSATVSTYIDSDLEKDNISVRYGSEEIPFEYVTNTGLLTFTTSHFSTFDIYVKTGSEQKPEPEPEPKVIVLTDWVTGTKYSDARDYIIGVILNAGGNSLEKENVKGIIFSSWEKYGKNTGSTSFNNGHLINATLNNSDGTSEDNNLVRSFYNGGTVYILTKDSNAVMTSNGEVRGDSQFSGFKQMTKIDFSGLDTSKVTNMSGFFGSCSSLTELDLSDLDTSSAASMSGFFGSCKSLKSIKFGEKFDTSSVTSMSNMFQGCSSLASVDLSRFNTSKVTSMLQMFQYCYGLTSLDLSGFDMSKVTTVNNMFQDCTSISSIRLWTTSSAELTDVNGMFDNCSALTSIDVSNLNTKKVTKMSYMFRKCTALETIDLTSFDTSMVTTMFEMFRDCTGLKTIDLSSFDTKKVQKMQSMFINCGNLETIYASESFVTTSVNDSGQQMFQGCTNLKGKCDGKEFSCSGAGDGAGKTYAKLCTAKQNGYFTKKS